jgi:hypothetical protein
MTEQLKYFGEYVLDMIKRPENLHKIRGKLLFQTRNKEPESIALAA